jgi:3-oxoacyl-[acyl-carrier protein] reductase
MAIVPVSGPPDMKGRIVFITGACGGIGRATVAALTAAGATVIASDVVEPTPPFGNDVSFHRCDVTSRAESERAVEEARRKHGRIDVMILCAGSVSGAPLETVTDEEWAQVQDVNVLGVINPARAIWPHMVAQQSGKFVLLGSVAVRIGGFAAGPAYVAAKAAVHGISKWMAKHGAPHGVTSNVVAPGPVETPMFEKVTERKAPKAADTIPLQRYGQPDDIAQAILFLASPQSNWITGAELNVNGGLVFD